MTVPLPKQAKNTIQRVGILSLLTDIDFFLFLCSKTFLGNYQIVEYITFTVFILLTLINCIKNRSFIWKTPYIIWYLLFAIFADASLLWALDYDSVFKSLPSVMALAVFTFALTNYAHQSKSTIKIIRLYILANTIAAVKILTLFFFISGTPANRIFQITGIQFNTVAQILAFAIILAAYLILKTKQKLYLIPIGIMLIAIILSGSRKALLIPIIGIIIILLLNLKNIKKYRKFIIIFSAITIAAGCFVAITPGPRQKFTNLISSSVFHQQTTDHSINLRNFFIDTGLTIWQQYPISGIGLNNFSYYVKNFTAYTEARYAHNNFIELLSSLGSIGFLLYYWFYLFIIAHLITSIHKKRTLENTVALSLIITLTIFEWGIVSYSGVMYNILIYLTYLASTQRTK